MQTTCSRRPVFPKLLSGPARCRSRCDRACSLSDTASERRCQRAAPCSAVHERVQWFPCRASRAPSTGRLQTSQKRNKGARPSANGTGPWTRDSASGVHRHHRRHHHHRRRRHLTAEAPRTLQSALKRGHCLVDRSNTPRRSPHDRLLLSQEVVATVRYSSHRAGSIRGSIDPELPEKL